MCQPVRGILSEALKQLWPLALSGGSRVDETSE